MGDSKKIRSGIMGACFLLHLAKTVVYFFITHGVERARRFWERQRERNTVSLDDLTVQRIDDDGYGNTEAAENILRLLFHIVFDACADCCVLHETTAFHCDCITTSCELQDYIIYNGLVVK